MLRRQLLRTVASTSRIFQPSRPIARVIFQPHGQCLQHSRTSYRNFSALPPLRDAEGRSAVDIQMEEINDLYSTARDEFEIAAEETEANTVYAADDRTAAREALTKLQEAYQAATSEQSEAAMSEEVKKRVGPRIRELENAVAGMEEMAMNQD